MNEWFETLEGLRDQAWNLMVEGASRPSSAMHTGALATIGLGGAAEARMVVLRGAVESDAVLDVHSDRAAHKVAELERTPLATLLLWDPEKDLQIRARLRVEILTGEAVEAEWQEIPDAGRVNYGGRPPPSSPLTRADAYRETVERDRFAVLRGHVTSLELLHLGQLHRRALFRRTDNFTGEWIAP